MTEARKICGIDLCKPIPTIGQREKDVWNDGFAHGWKEGFDGAHDLLEALEGLKLILLQWHEDLPDHVGDKEGAYLAKASAAIAKARNATPFIPAEGALDAEEVLAAEPLRNAQIITNKQQSEKSMSIDIIEIQITGPVASGKSAIFATIKSALERHDICVAVLDRSERRNPSSDLDDCASHERPKLENCVVVMRENSLPLSPGQGDATK